MSCFVRPAWRARVNLAPLEEEEREKRAAAFLFSVLLPAFDARGRFCVPVIAPARWPFSRDGRWAGIRIRYGASGRAGATGRAMRRERERKRERPRAGVRCGRRARCARTRACAENLINTLPGRVRGAACVRACPGAQRRALRGPPMVRTRTTHTPALPSPSPFTPSPSTLPSPFIPHQESLKLASLPRSPFTSSPATRGVLPGAVDLRGGCPPPANPAAQRDAERDALRSLASPAHLAASSASSPASSSSARDAAWTALSLGCLPVREWGRQGRGGAWRARPTGRRAPSCSFQLPPASPPPIPPPAPFPPPLHTAAERRAGPLCWRQVAV